MSGGRMFQAEKLSDAKVLRREGEWYVTSNVRRPVWLERGGQGEGH